MRIVQGGVVAAGAAVAAWIMSALFNVPVAEIIRDAGIDTTAMSPRVSNFLQTILYLIIGGAIYGLTLGNPKVAGWFAERRLRKLEGIEEAFDRKVVGWLPRDSEPIDSLTDSRSSLFEAMSSMAEKVMFETLKHPPRHLVITSTRAAEGKSTTAFGLGVILSRRGKKVLIIDADLRSPSQHYIFSEPSEKGVATAIQSGQNILDYAVESRFSNLYLIPAGKPPSNPTELISSEYFVGQIEDCKSKFDVVILDSPPVLGLADAPSLCRYADLVIYAIRYGSVRKKLSLSAFRRINNPNVVLAGVALPEKAYGFGYGYSYSYSYNYRDNNRPETNSAIMSILYDYRDEIVFFASMIALVIGAVVLINYSRPSKISELGNGIEDVRNQNDTTRIQVHLDRFKDSSRSVIQASKSIEIISNGVKKELDDVVEGNKFIDIVFTHSFPDRLGNSEKRAVLRARFSQKDLKYVNLNEISGPRLFTLAEKVYYLSAEWRADVRKKCVSGSSELRAARLCDGK